MKNKAIFHKNRLVDQEFRADTGMVGGQFERLHLLCKILERDLDGREQVSLRKRFDEVAKRAGARRSLHRFRVAERGEEDKRQVETLADLRGQPNAVFFPFNIDVQNSEVGVAALQNLDGLLSAHRITGDLVAALLKVATDGIARDKFVFDDQDPDVFFHCKPGFCFQAKRSLVVTFFNILWNEWIEMLG